MARAGFDRRRLVATRPAVAIVADDLTGAMDAAGPFSGGGRATQVAWKMDAPAGPEPHDPPDVLSVSTASRHLPPAEAAAATHRAVARATRAGPAILFKKIDSTLRGNVAVEIEAALAASGRRHAVLAPAVPAQMRALVNGELRVEDVPVTGDRPAVSHESRSVRPAEAFARDAPGVSIRTHVAPAGLDLHDPGERPVVHVVDCESETDLKAIAAAALPLAEDVLFVGAAGLSKALAELIYGDPAPRELCSPGAEGPLLFVVGSLADASRTQAETLRATCPLVEDMVGGEEPVPPRPSSCTADLVLIHSDPTTRHADALRMATRLAARAESLIAARQPRGLVLTGGDTAWAVLDRFGVTALDVIGEAAPGVVVGRCEIRGRPTTVVTKAGGFGDADLFVDLARRL